MGDPFITERPDSPATPAHSQSLAARQIELSAQMDAIRWGEFDTAYDAPRSVPLDLKLLMFGDLEQALRASHRLWCGLCHQHAYMSSAAEPAVPYLLLALQESCDAIRIEILDIVLGFIRCQRRELGYTQRTLLTIVEKRPEIEGLKGSSNDEVADLVESVCEALDQTQAEQDVAANP